MLIAATLVCFMLSFALQRSIEHTFEFILRKITLVFPFIGLSLVCSVGITTFNIVAAEELTIEIIPNRTVTTTASCFRHSWLDPAD